jgi:hypothetical protein
MRAGEGRERNPSEGREENLLQEEVAMGLGPVEMKAF